VSGVVPGEGLLSLVWCGPLGGVACLVIRHRRRGGGAGWPGGGGLGEGVLLPGTVAVACVGGDFVPGPGESVLGLGLTLARSISAESRSGTTSPTLSLTAGTIGFDIRPSARGRGHATAMLAVALPAAHGLGIDPVLLTTRDHNLAGRKVIEANGGQLIDRRGDRLYFHVPTAQT
jgi:GNAT superfamily N-acetyltransferase